MGKIPQKLHETESLDIVNLSSLLKPHYQVEVVSIDEISNALASNAIDVESNFFFFCSSQIEQYKNAIFDVVFEVHRRGGILVPEIDFYLAHENKYFQEMHKARARIKTPRSRLISTSMTSTDFSSPVVVKPYSGFGSQGVKLATSSKELENSIRKNMSRYIIEKLDIREILKRYIKRSIKYPNEYPDKVGRVILQDFIPELKHDWKVLVFGDKAFALKRFTRKNDFRASGSGNFDYSSKASFELIRFAFDTRESLNVPFVSLDVAESSLGFNIIEYQAVHFGLATAVNAQHYYHIDDDSLVISECDNVDIEELFATSICKFVKG